jgi:hypothetical protein
MRLPVAQRSSVILMDVLGCSLQEICEVMDFSLPAAKAALHRGRTQLRELPMSRTMRRNRLVGGRSRAARRLCRAFQRARFRRHPRHDRRRRAARSRQQDAPERQGRGVQLFRQLLEGQRLASGARAGRGHPAILVFDPERTGLAIKIGFVSTFSGPTAVIGNDMRNSFELALDHLGRKMGGKPVEVIYEDDQQKPDVGKQKTEKLIQSDKVDFIAGYIWSNVLLASLKTAVDSQDLPDQRQCRTLADRRRAVLALRVLDLLAERPDAAGDGPLHEPEGRQVGVPDRPELCRRQGHAGRRQEHVQGQVVGEEYTVWPSQLDFSAELSKARASKAERSSCSIRAPPACSSSINMRRPASRADPALHRVHHRRIVAAAAEGPRARRSRRAAVGQRSAERREQEVRRRLPQESTRPAPDVLRRAVL